jgi:hypothetical protein
MTDLRVTVSIDKDGNTKIDYIGGEGTDCMDLYGGFDQAMGADMATLVLKPEYYRRQRERAVLLRNSNDGKC